MRFKGKVVLVTGSNQNTGLEIAALFIQEGAKVIVNGPSETTLMEGVSRLQQMGLNGFVPIVADISNPRDVTLMFEQIKNKFDRLDILVNNACHQGIGKKFDSMEYEDFTEVINVNILGTFLVSQESVKMMLTQKSKGVIVNIGSNVSTRAIHNRTAYITSKGGIDALTRSMSTDLGPRGIRVNLIAPGYIYTDRWEILEEDIKERRRKNIPLGKEATCKDIAKAVAFFASEESIGIGGSRLVVDGGCSAQHMPQDIDF